MTLTFQDAFNRVFTHLDEQGKRAVNQKNHCTHLAPDGSKCALGALIPDGHPAQTCHSRWDVHRVADEYSDLAGIAWPKGFISSQVGFPKKTSGLCFMSKLQSFHDSASTPEAWKFMMNEKLPKFAETFGLTVPERIKK